MGPKSGTSSGNVPHCVARRRWYINATHYDQARLRAFGLVVKLQLTHYVARQMEGTLTFSKLFLNRTASDEVQWRSYLLDIRVITKLVTKLPI